LPDFVLVPSAARILALDVGKKRIGLAVSDALGISAQGLPTFQRTRIREDLRQLAAVVREREISLLLVGHPLHMSGTESRQAVYTREFAERLRDETGVPVVYWDERLTTVEAERVLQESSGPAGGSAVTRKLSRLSARGRRRRRCVRVVFVRCWLCLS
jgi:putative holliday junction resolvase